MRADWLAALCLVAGAARADDEPRPRADDSGEHHANKRDDTAKRHRARVGKTDDHPGTDDRARGDDHATARDDKRDHARVDDHPSERNDTHDHSRTDDRSPARDDKGDRSHRDDHPAVHEDKGNPRADDHPTARDDKGDRVRDEHPTARDDKRDAATDVSEQLAAQSQTIDRTLATVGEKLAAADAARAARIRAAYRVLCAPALPVGDAAERMAAARRRAAARMLLARDADERRLLADEAGRLHAAGERVVAATSKLPTLSFPADLAWPARGTIARHFGLFGHERSKTTLSRRGIDLDVDEHQPASAPADGTVRYAGPIRGLGHGVIIDHGDFLTVVAKLGELTIPAGTVVRRGDRVGRAARHRVYLEVRVRVGPGGLAVDPEPLLAKHKK